MGYISHAMCVESNAIRSLSKHGPPWSLRQTLRHPSCCHSADAAHAPGASGDSPWTPDDAGRAAGHEACCDPRRKSIRSAR